MEAYKGVLLFRILMRNGQYINNKLIKKLQGNCIFSLYIFESTEISLTFTDGYATVLITINSLDDFL